MDSESIGEAKSALAAFPGLADVTVIEHGAGQDDQCLIAYVVPSGPGLDVPELHAYARKRLTNGSMPAAIMVVDEVPKTAAGLKTFKFANHVLDFVALEGGDHRRSVSCGWP